MLGPEQEEAAGMVALRLGRQELGAMMIYTHTLKRDRGGPRSSAEGMFLCQSRPSGT